MDPVTIADLDAAALLAAAEETVTARRAAIVDDFRLALAWADLHGADPRDQPGAVSVRFGGDRLVDYGGDGTPAVSQLCVEELAIARHAHAISTRLLMADALDLRHRLPRTWVVVQELRCEPWVAAKVAAMSRHLTLRQIGVVDAAVAAAIAGQAPSRVLRIAEAAVIAADPVGHADAVEEQRRARSVHVTKSDEESGLRTVVARLEAGEAAWVDATVDRVADLLAADPELRAREHPDLPDGLEGVSKQELRAVALGWLARPHDLARLIGVLDDADAPAGNRPSAVVHVHLHHDTLGRGLGVARVEELGPMVLDQVRRLLGHAHVTLRPVLDLRETVSVNRYEHPAAVRDRITQLMPGDAFPHASSLTRRIDLDHPDGYLRPDHGGPPGQTGDHAANPLSRRSHRAKTHLGYTVRQIDRTAWVWRTPHGRWRLVDESGTHPLDESAARALVRPDWLDDVLDRLGTGSPTPAS